MSRVFNILKNSIAIDYLMLLFQAEGHWGEYLVFCDGETHYADSFDEAMSMGEEVFGEDAGFVVRLVEDPGDTIPSAVRQRILNKRIACA